MEILSVETHYFCKESHKKEVQLGKVSKRWEGVNLKTYFFKIKNNEIFARREGVRVKMSLFFIHIEWFL